jgi:hypothetical protein
VNGALQFRTVRVAVIGLVALMTTFTSAGAAVARPVSGLRGLVMKGPTEPVCRSDDPCEAPAGGILLDFRRDGKVVAEVKTTRLGTYSVRLKAGSYAVVVPRHRVGTGLSPRVVRVPRGRIARVDFHLDTGLQ